ncbi:MAG: nucleoside:proton symporter, partial [Rhodobacteraceae bacterium]|nr:nucleoside:proton symporter [Paracoccaceae bacterium]
ASLISLPAALAVARLMEPPGAESVREVGAESLKNAPEEPENLPKSAAENAPRYLNSVDALAQGGLDGMRLFLNIVAILIVVVATVALCDSILGLAGEVAGAPLSLQRIFGWIFAPVAALMGAPISEAASAGALFGTKAVLNEFFAYLELAALPEGELSARTRLIMLYAMCGFANLGSIGILLGVTAAIAPSRRPDISGFALKAWLAGNLATAMTGAMIGILTPAG